MQITEENTEIIEAWFKERPESIDAFIEELSTRYQHDYGTICKAMAAVGIAAMWKMDKTPQGGITGFQASAVMWEFIQHWMKMEGPLRLVRYEDMLYPQCGHKFEKTISKNTAEYLVDEAKKRLLESRDAHPEVLAHWQLIADGKLPFGYTISQED